MFSSRYTRNVVLRRVVIGGGKGSGAQAGTGAATNSESRRRHGTCGRHGRQLERSVQLLTFSGSGRLVVQRGAATAPRPNWYRLTWRLLARYQP